MATSLYKAQFALKICSDHENKELHAYCKSCTKKICSSCIKEEHNSHDWEMITDILREKRRSLPEECKEIRIKQLPGLRKEIDHFERKIEEVDTKLEQNKSVLKDSRQRYINVIKQLFDDRIDYCTKKSEAAKQMYEEKRDGLKQKVEYLEMMTTSLDKDINTLPDHDILDMEKEMRDELEKALSYSSDKYTSTAFFIPGQMNVQVLGEMIGDVKSFSMEEKHDIDRCMELIKSLKPVSDTNALVRVENSRSAKMIDIYGKEVKSMKTACLDFVIPSDGTFVLTDYLNCSLLVLTEAEDKIRTIDTSPLHPKMISKTSNGDILVSLQNSKNDYNVTLTSRRIVQRMSLTGKVLHTYEFREDGKTRLFTSAVRSAENTNSDVCVINRHNQDSGELIGLHKDGRVKFISSGGKMDSEMFLPYDVECDSKGHILLTEKYSKAINLLSDEGLLLCTLYQHHRRPFVISFHESTLWCGFVEGRIKVFKYEN